MKKLNNKGITLVELIVSFAILMVVVIGMLNVIINFKEMINEKKFLQEMTEYKTTLTYEINRDLIEKGFISIEDCSTSLIECKNINFADSTVKQLKIELENYIITYDEIKYPIPEEDLIEFLDNRVHANTDNSKNVFITADVNFFKINIPYYEIGKDVNYGIDIIYPLS